MNEIVIDLDKFSPKVRDALKDRAVREGKPMKALLLEMIETTTQTINTAAGEQQEGAA